MTDDTIEPALTPDEWEREKFKSRVGRENRHALAAKLLHGQPFGFTHEDVDLLRGLHDYTRGEDNQAGMAALAARIEALLPPREPNEP